MHRILLGFFLISWAFGAQAQFIDDSHAECVAASNAPLVAEADGMTFQSAEQNVPRVTWVVWENTVDFCIRARTYSNRNQQDWRVNVLANWMGNNVMDVSAAGAYASIVPVQRVAAIFEDRIARRCGDDRDCRAEHGQSAVRNIGNAQVRYGSLRFDGGSVDLIFLEGDLIGGVLQRDGRGPAEVRFRELQ